MKVRRALDKGLDHLLMFEGLNDNNVPFVSFEIERAKDNIISLEHIYRLPKFEGIKALPKVIEWIEHHFKPRAIICLPLNQYVPYYESLGFEFY